MPLKEISTPKMQEIPEFFIWNFTEKKMELEIPEESLPKASFGYE